MIDVRIFPIVRLCLKASLPLAMIVAAPATAQVAGFPLDPTQDSSYASGSRPSDRTGSTRTARDAADRQAAVPTDGQTSYEAVQIRDERDPAFEDRYGGDDSYEGTRRPLTAEERVRLDSNQDLARTARRLPPPSEFEQYVSKIVDKPLRRFGANLLIPDARGFTTPPTTTVPTDYRLNPGDELLIGLTGSVEASNLRLTIDSEGRIFIPKVGSVDVAGVRYGDVQALIARAVARQYRNFRVAVSVGRLHGITVYVTGFAARPGSYTVSSLSTLVNAVLAAGGPSGGGSFRSIQVRRSGRLISDFDLYDLLLKGDKSSDVLLQNDDVIYIAPAGAQVAVVGSVNVEAIYEARANETIYDMLIYAGGINTVAENSRLLVFDPVNPGGWQEVSAGQVQQRVAARGEIVRVLSSIGIAQPQFRQPALVTISGEVANPGRYYVQPGTSVAAVIARAGGLTPQAYPYGAVFTREAVRATQRESYERAMRDVELLLTTGPMTSARSGDQLQPTRMAAIQSVVQQLRARQPDGRIVLGVQPADTSLPTSMYVENNDSIYVPPQPVTVGVFGAVPSPASFEYRRGMRINDYLRQAGGVQKIGDKSQIFVVRANGTLLSRASAMRAYALPGDLVFVPINAMRGEFWERLRDVSAAVLPAIVTAAAVAK